MLRLFYYNFFHILFRIIYLQSNYLLILITHIKNKINKLKSRKNTKLFFLKFLYEFVAFGVTFFMLAKFFGNLFSKYFIYYIYNIIDTIGCIKSAQNTRKNKPFGTY